MNQLYDIRICRIDSLNLPVEQLGTPYAFVAGQNKKAMLVFVPDKDIPDLSQQYYQIVKERFFH
jgi:hypothetical protein